MLFNNNNNNNNNSSATSHVSAEKITIIYPPTVFWHLLYQRPQQLLTAFSKIEGVRAIFVNPGPIHGTKNPVLQLNEDLFIVKHGVNYSHLIQGKKVLWFNFPPQFIQSKGYDLTVFDAIDNPTEEFAAWQKDLVSAVRVSNLVSCTADVMYQYHVKSGKPTFMCPNGSDYHHFVKASNKLLKPADFPIFGTEKVVGFYGAMASWVDYDIILKIAEKYKVVLIGNTNHAKNNLNHPNIINLPHKDYSVLPNYLSHFDVTIVPFKLTEMIKGCDPIKYYEFLAAGKPVLATDMYELQKYSDITYFMDINNCQEMVEKALAENSPELQEKRKAVARANSWDARAQLAIQKIRELL